MFDLVLYDLCGEGVVVGGVDGFEIVLEGCKVVVNIGDENDECYYYFDESEGGMVVVMLGGVVVVGFGKCVVLYVFILVFVSD